MTKTFPFTIASVHKTTYAGNVESVTLPGNAGEMTVLANHAPLVTTLKAGSITIRTAEGEVEVFPVERGILDVGGNRAIVLVD